jgi:hypothetical protein
MVYANLVVLTSRAFESQPVNLSIHGPDKKHLEILLFPPSVLIKPETYSLLVFISH